jgi:multimeric flavodoxin WrbA
VIRVLEKVLGVCGSPRKGGNSDVLLQRLLKGVAAEDIVPEGIRLREYQFQSCSGCERCRQEKQCVELKDGMQLIYPKIKEAKGLVLVSPIHNYNMTALMKAFIDRLYCFYDFADERPGSWSSRLANQGRKAILIAIGEQRNREEAGMDLTLQAMRLCAEALGYEVISELPVLGVFGKGEIKRHPEELDKAEALGKLLAQSISYNAA